MGRIYHNPNSEKQVENVAIFERVCERFPWLTFKQPNPKAAPWHYQTVVRWKNNPVGIVVNFWPHRGKAQIENEKPVVGEEAIRGLLARAIDESEDVEAFEVLEE